MTQPHTPLPWKASEFDEEGHYVITNQSGSACIAYGAGFYGEENPSEANAQLIVRAVNSHARLVALLNEAVGFVPSLIEAAQPEDDSELEWLAEARAALK